MTGKYLLTYPQINSVVPAITGTYILVNSNNNAVYVGRSDSDLNSRLKNHLPESEKNASIIWSGPTHFYFESTENPFAAYTLECEWYHKYRPNCNTAHPNKASPLWSCPVCEL